MFLRDHIGVGTRVRRVENRTHCGRVDAIFAMDGARRPEFSKAAVFRVTWDNGWREDCDREELVRDLAQLPSDWTPREFPEPPSPPPAKKVIQQTQQQQERVRPRPLEFIRFEEEDSKPPPPKVKAAARQRKPWTRKEIIDQLKQADLQSLDKSILDAACQAIGQSARGTKNEIIRRIRSVIKQEP